MTDKTTPDSPSNDISINDALARSQKAFSAAYKERNGVKNNSYALLARENFDALILAGKIHPSNVEFALEKNIDYFLDEAKTDEEQDKDLMLNNSMNRIGQRLEQLEKSNVELKEQNNRLEEQNKEQIQIALNAQEDSKRAKKALVDAKAELKEETNRVSKKLDKSERAKKRSDCIAIGVTIFFSIAGIALTLHYGKDKPVTNDTTPPKEPNAESCLKDQSLSCPKFKIEPNKLIAPTSSKNDAGNNGLLFDKDGTPVLVPRGKKVRPTEYTPK